MFKKSKKEQPHDDTQPPTSQTTSQQNAQPQQPAQPKPPPLPLPQESIKVRTAGACSDLSCF
ncbi:hypothetical protein M427DRAFT_52549 [Gonapodya prolifera JEL478]|uniref:Uncharacterized protein n=1 Tax=Gonapodya prolifera (strain JEL478) TaxID=1344416 RepID=A0A139AUE8_GONPJ|nr:hypothetical protein M427DRAFT_52549 [Gonapodya prolifera JEL478]|eukprot:KXS20329.1 hypothetical protein M427DRAFT_52549 [Gonapodya prolifera JEL478]